MAIQMAKAAGARAIATSRGADKAAAALKLGADVSIDTNAEDFVERIKAEGGADVILDMVGGAYTPKNLSCLKPLGRNVLIATQGGAKAEIDLMRLMRDRLVLTGSTLRPRSADEKARLDRRRRSTRLALDRNRQDQADRRQNFSFGRGWRGARLRGKRKPCWESGAHPLKGGHASLWARCRGARRRAQVQRPDESLASVGAVNLAVRNASMRVPAGQRTTFGGRHGRRQSPSRSRRPSI